MIHKGPPGLHVMVLGRWKGVRCASSQAPRDVTLDVTCTMETSIRTLNSGSGVFRGQF